MGILELDLEKGLYLGIDFGTTNSVVSIYNAEMGEVQTIPIDGSNIFPTAIQFEPDLEDEGKLMRVFGVQAKEAAIIYPQSTVLSVKRFFGSKNKVDIVVDGNSFSFTPEQIAGEILSYMKQKAEEYIQDELGIFTEFNGCVITVPANSTDKQKKVTKKAAILAGFDEDAVYLRLEPAAASISYAIGEKSDKKVLIYDFGGGTFDACILEVCSPGTEEPSITILSTYGDNDLGGNDIDKIIMDMVYEQFRQITDGVIDLFDLDTDDGVSVRSKQIALIRLLQASNQAKERLSKSKSTKIILAPFIQEPKIVNINMEITCDDFYNHKRVNQLDDSLEIFEKFKGKSVNDIIDITFGCMDSCMKAAGVTAEQIDEIFLVGGSSSITLISDKIEEKFGKAPFRSRISPALSISQGAAYYCNMITSPSEKRLSVNERTVHPLGLEISGRRFLEVVRRGMDIPPGGLTVEADELLMTNLDDATSMAIVVYENAIASEGILPATVNEEGMKRLGGTSLRGIPQNQKGAERVKVIFNISQDNMLKVTASSTSTAGAVTELSVDDMY
ncbi:MAG: Hsp70 family protein [Defluviitaleaceae bacterium]|nr:Hsp70 family protein [Defluviitaleaceae bacterium]